MSKTIDNLDDITTVQEDISTVQDDVQTINNTAHFTGAGNFDTGLGNVLLNKVSAVSDNDPTECAYTFDISDDDGIYHIAADNFGLATAGVLRAEISNQGIGLINGTESLPSYFFSSDPDTGFYRDVADNGVLRIATNGSLHTIFSTGALTSALPIVYDNGTAGVTVALSSPFGNAGMTYSSSSGGNYTRFDVRNIPNATVGNRSYRLAYSGAGGGVELFHAATAWSAVSDRKLKENLVKPQNSCDLIKDMTGYKYNLKSQSVNDKKYGLIADEVFQSMPEICDDSSVFDADGNVIDVVKSVRYTEMIPVLLNAINELRERLDAL